MCCMAEPKVYEILRWQIDAGPQEHRSRTAISSSTTRSACRAGTKAAAAAARRRARCWPRTSSKCMAYGPRAKTPASRSTSGPTCSTRIHNAAEDGPLLSGQGRRPVVRLLGGLGQGRGDRQLELGSRQAGGVAAALRRPGPPADPGRLLRRAGGRDQRLAARRRAGAGRHRRDVHDVAAASTATWRRSLLPHAYSQSRSLYATDSSIRRTNDRAACSRCVTS